ncbi:MAG: zinc-binding dehydrogenase [Halodesulfurarchaeum sp.]
MRAMVITEFGGTDVFEEREVPRPEPGPTEVLVRVHATSVNPVDTKIRQAGSWAGVEPPEPIGYDVSGVVADVGDGVSDFAVGDPVFYTPEIFEGEGSYAEYHVADESIVAHKPPSLEHTEAAALPLAGGTAWDAVVERTEVGPGEVVLVHGTGGVGSIAVQLALASGARVVPVSSPETADDMEAFGAERAINYREEDFVEVLEETFEDPVDVVVDTVGGETLAESMEVVRPHARLVTVQPPEGDWGSAYLENPTVHLLFLERERYKLDGLRRMVEQGALEPYIDSVLPLSEVAEAHDRVEAGGLSGKVVLDVAGE